MNGSNRNKTGKPVAQSAVATDRSGTPLKSTDISAAADRINRQTNNFMQTPEPSSESLVSASVSEPGKGNRDRRRKAKARVVLQIASAPPKNQRELETKEESILPPHIKKGSLIRPIDQPVTPRTPATPMSSSGLAIPGVLPSSESKSPSSVNGSANSSVQGRSARFSLSPVQGGAFLTPTKSPAPVQPDVNAQASRSILEESEIEDLQDNARLENILRPQGELTPRSLEEKTKEAIAEQKELSKTLTDRVQDDLYIFNGMREDPFDTDDAKDSDDESDFTKRLKSQKAKRIELAAKLNKLVQLADACRSENLVSQLAENLKSKASILPELKGQRLLSDSFFSDQVSKLDALVKGLARTTRVTLNRFKVQEGPQGRPSVFSTELEKMGKEFFNLLDGKSSANLWMLRNDLYNSIVQKINFFEVISSSRAQQFYKELGDFCDKNTYVKKKSTNPPGVVILKKSKEDNGWANGVLQELCSTLNFVNGKIKEASAGKSIQLSISAEPDWSVHAGYLECDPVKPWKLTSHVESVCSKLTIYAKEAKDDLLLEDPFSYTEKVVKKNRKVLKYCASEIGNQYVELQKQKAKAEIIIPQIADKVVQENRALLAQLEALRNSVAEIKELDHLRKTTDAFHEAASLYESFMTKVFDQQIVKLDASVAEEKFKWTRDKITEKYDVMIARRRTQDALLESAEKKLSAFELNIAEKQQQFSQGDNTTVYAEFYTVQAKSLSKKLLEYRKTANALDDDDTHNKENPQFGLTTLSTQIGMHEARIKEVAKLERAAHANIMTVRQDLIDLSHKTTTLSAEVKQLEGAIDLADQEAKTKSYNQLEQSCRALAITMAVQNTSLRELKKNVSQIATKRDEFFKQNEGNPGVAQRPAVARFLTEMSDLTSDQKLDAPAGDAKRESVEIQNKFRLADASDALKEIEEKQITAAKSKLQALEEVRNAALQRELEQAAGIIALLRMTVCNTVNFAFWHSMVGFFGSYSYIFRSDRESVSMPGSVTQLFGTLSDHQAKEAKLLSESKDKELTVDQLKQKLAFTTDALKTISAEAKERQRLAQQSWRYRFWNFFGVLRKDSTAKLIDALAAIDSKEIGQSTDTLRKNLKAINGLTLPEAKSAADAKQGETKQVVEIKLSNNYHAFTKGCILSAQAPEKPSSAAVSKMKKT